METHQTLYQNESRAVTLTILDQDNVAFTTIDSVTYTVENVSESVIVTSTAATVSSNTMTAVIGTTVTANIGDYFIIWKITDTDGYIYYHKTALEVLSI